MRTGNHNGYQVGYNNPILIFRCRAIHWSGWLLIRFRIHPTRQASCWLQSSKQTGIKWPFSPQTECCFPLLGHPLPTFVWRYLRPVQCTSSSTPFEKSTISLLISFQGRFNYSRFSYNIAQDLSWVALFVVGHEQFYYHLITSDTKDFFNEQPNN